MTINLEPDLGPQTLVPVISKVTPFDPVIKPSTKISILFAHPGIKRIDDSGAGQYVQALLNDGWRWDTGGGNVIRWNVGANYHLSIGGKDTSITTDPKWVTAIQDEVHAAFKTWEAVADINDQFSPSAPQIIFHAVPHSVYNLGGFGGYSGTPYEAAESEEPITAGPVLFDNTATVADSGIVHVYLKDNAGGFLGQPVWNVDAKTGIVTVTDVGKEMFIHEIGHALGLKHPFDSGTNGTEIRFPGIDPKSATPTKEQMGDFNLGSKFGTIMSYTEADPDLTLPFGGAPGGAILTPMAYDIAAIQTLYGANTLTAFGNDTYTLTDGASPEGQTWQCIWDTGGVDQIVYNGAAQAHIDLRPATLDDSPSGAGYGSYTYDFKTQQVSRGGTIAGDATNALPDVNGVTGVIIENAQGGSGDDTIIGNDVDNVLQGGAGNDVISALAGNDIINGNDGNDTMTGGAGSDVFIFDFDFPAKGASHDVITDFDATSVNHDFIDVADLAINSLSDFNTFVQMAQVGADTQIHIGATQIDLLGVDASTIPVTDFRFV